jgi:hypothetical protein
MLFTRTNVFDKFWMDIVKEGDHLEDFGLDVRIILK